MFVVTENTIRDLFSIEDAVAAVESAFAAMARGKARNFAVVREAIGHGDALYGFKSGFDATTLTLGVKAGGYWPGNAARGLTNHQSTVALFNADSGQLHAIVAGNHLTALRTAAACAVSIRYLARPDARTLGILGAGHQALFQLRAAAAARSFDRVLAWNHSPDKLAALADAAAGLGLAFECVDRARLAAEADVIVTITSCFEALLTREHIRPGTHIAAMGTDTQGKQELDPALVAAARRFTDEPAQAATIGECQHAIAQGLIAADAIARIGDVITAATPGRRHPDDITLFDSTGVGLQDLAVAAVALERACAADRVHRMSLID